MVSAYPVKGGGGGIRRILLSKLPSGPHWEVLPGSLRPMAEGAGFEPARPCGLPVFKLGNRL
jgi:hypothetical protein